ncbi:MAG TPA: hypothetical protein VF261_02060, partial [Candidatus Saccharimonadales bacterium]
MSNFTRYLHDRLVLLLLSINTFLTLAVCVFVPLQLGANHGNGYIVQCRDCSNIANIDRFTNGSVWELLGFIVFALLVLAV